tara:strand:+ start:1301 stop:1663 length:363 start_codon:yes stop_codon:yes gene_type:complete
MAISQKLKDAIQAAKERTITKSFVWINKATKVDGEFKDTPLSESDWDTIKSDSDTDIYYNMWFKCAKESDIESAHAELDKTILVLKGMGLSLSNNDNHFMVSKDGTAWSKLIVGRDLNRS